MKDSENFSDRIKIFKNVYDIVQNFAHGRQNGIEHYNNINVVSIS